MTSKLPPINPVNLLCQRQVEGERIEIKAGWNLDANLRTLAAFAKSTGGSLKIGIQYRIVTLLLSSNFGLVT